MPALVPSAKRYFEEGFTVPSYGTVRGQTYESNVPFVLRFMIDNNIQGSDWIVVPKNTYSIRNPHQSGGHNNDLHSSVAVEKQIKISRCSLEIDVYYNHIQAQPCMGLYSAIAPLRVLSFDIECQGRKGKFSSYYLHR